MVVDAEAAFRWRCRRKRGVSSSELQDRIAAILPVKLCDFCRTEVSGRDYSNPKGHGYEKSGSQGKGTQSTPNTNGNDTK